MKQNLQLSICALLCYIAVCPVSMLQAEVEKNKPVVLVLLGPPGSGRDLLAVRVSSSYCLPYISSADLLVDYSDEESDIGKEARKCLHTGSEIPDSLVLRLIADRMKQSDCERGFLLDGFPKTVAQSKALKETFEKTLRILPVNVRSSDEWLVNFHEGRLVCTNCGRVYHTDRSPPKSQDECDFCDQPLVQREDDSPETLKSRSENYRNMVMPILNYFRDEKLLVEIDGTKSLEEMMSELKPLLILNDEPFIHTAKKGHDYPLAHQSLLTR